MIGITISSFWCSIFLLFIQYLTLLYQTWKAYGNWQPSPLLAAEQELWKVLYQIAIHDTDLQKTLEGFFSSILWEQLNALSPTEQTWLNTCV